jgi:hypothetical protein
LSIKLNFKRPKKKDANNVAVGCDLKNNSLGGFFNPLVFSPPSSLVPFVHVTQQSLLMLVEKSGSDKISGGVRGQSAARDYTFTILIESESPVTGEAGLESGETYQMISSTSTSELSYRVWGSIVGMFLSKLDLKLLSLLCTETAC